VSTGEAEEPGRSSGRSRRKTRVDFDYSNRRDVNAPIRTPSSPYIEIMCAF
jgi:hypothetical protein